MDLDPSSRIWDGEDEASDEHQDDAHGRKLLEVGKPVQHGRAGDRETFIRERIDDSKPVQKLLFETEFWPQERIKLELPD